MGFVALAVLFLLGVRWSKAPKLKPTDEILVADFVNESGDPVFNTTLGRGLTIQLEQSPYLRLISEPQARQILGRTGAAFERALERPGSTQRLPACGWERCFRREHTP